MTASVLSIELHEIKHQHVSSGKESACHRGMIEPQITGTPSTVIYFIQANLAWICVYSFGITYKI